MVSALDQAKRALVALLRTLAAAYACSVKVARDSADAEVRTAYRAVSRKVHPDRPTGSAADQKRLNASHDKWQALLKAAPGRGRKRGAAAPGAAPPRAAAPAAGLATVGLAGAASGKKGPKEYKIRGHGVLLTYQGVTGVEQWVRLTEFYKASLKKLRVKFWCSTLEANAEGGVHAHVMLQFKSERDCTVKAFSFEGLRPNAQANDLLGEGWCKKRLQQSLDRAMFYVWANKLGTQRLPTGSTGPGNGAAVPHPPGRGYSAARVSRVLRGPLRGRQLRASMD